MKPSVSLAAKKYWIVAALLLVLMMKQSASVCPPNQEIVPCRCNVMGDDGFTIELICDNYFYKLNDTRMSEILDVLITWPRVSPLRRVHFEYTELTRVPSQFSHRFPLLNEIDMTENADDGVIVKAGDFNFSVAVCHRIDLSGWVSSANNIYTNLGGVKSIQNGAFQGLYGNSLINLRNGFLTRFEQGVFQNVLEQMLPYAENRGTYVDVGNNPIDCVNDPCHLAWLCRDNRHLLPVVDGSCITDIKGNGTQLVQFEDLDPKLFENCGRRNLLQKLVDSAFSLL